jgi:HEAT repeat protein
VRLQDPGAFPGALEFALAHLETAPPTVFALILAMKGVNDAALAPHVRPLLSSPETYWRLAGVYALRHMKTREAVPWVVPALSDPSLEVQYQAVMCLAECTGRYDVGAPAIDLFEQNPSHYTDRWVQWWEAEGKAVYAAPPEEQPEQESDPID